MCACVNTNVWPSVLYVEYSIYSIAYGKSEYFWINCMDFKDLHMTYLLHPNPSCLSPSPRHASTHSTFPRKLILPDIVTSWQEVTTVTFSRFVDCHRSDRELLPRRGGWRKWQRGPESHGNKYTESNCKTIVERTAIRMNAILNCAQLAVKSIKTHAVYYQLTEIKCFCRRNAGRFNFCGMNMLNEPLLLQPSDAKQASGWKKDLTRVMQCHLSTSPC